MYLKIITVSILILSLVVIQLAFVSALPAWLSNLNVVLVILIMILGFGNFKNALMGSMIVGAFLDMFSFSLFGLNIFVLLVSVLLANFLLENVLTNRSLYTFLALIFSVSLLHELLIFLIIFLLAMFFDQSLMLDLSSVFLLDELSKIIVNLIFTFVLFHIVSFFNKRFKPMFLIR